MVAAPNLKCVYAIDKNENANVNKYATAATLLTNQTCPNTSTEKI